MRAVLLGFLLVACASSHEEEEAPSQLEIETGVAWNVEQVAGTVTYAEPRAEDSGPTPAGATSTEAALAFLDAHASAFGMLQPRVELAPEVEGVDRLGLRYATFLPKNDPNGRVSVHFEPSGRIAFLSARYGATPMTKRSLETRRAPCFLEAHGKGVHAYAQPPLRNDDDIKTFEVTQNGSLYEMRSGPLSCEQAETGIVTSSKLDEWDTTGTVPGAAVDAYFHASKTLEFYRTVLARKSWDDQDGAISLFVSQDSSTAAWSTGSIGFGAPPTDKPSPALSYAGAFDAIAHEIQHGVTETTLRFGDSSLGVPDGIHSEILNESFSDIFAAFAEHWYRPGPGNVTLAEDVAAPSYPPTRDLAHPSHCLAGACPDHISKLDPEADVHLGTGISSNAWYLMTLGGTNDTSGATVTEPLGWDASLDVWYALVVSRAVPISARFRDVALASVALARRAGNVRAAACAWIAVGVLTPTLAERFWNVRC